MNKITLIDPLHKTPEEIVWHNLQQADSIHHLEYFIASVSSWMHLHPDQSYHDLERELRLREFDTYLYATKPKHTFPFKLVPSQPEKKQELIYEGIYSCRPKPYALQEVLSFWPTYEDNLKALESAGQVSVIDETTSPKVFHQFDQDQKDKFELIVQHQKELMVHELSVEDVIHDITLKFGQTPEHQLIGLTSTGSPILAFVIDNKIASNVGVIYEINSEGQHVTKLVRIFN